MDFFNAFLERLVAAFVSWIEKINQDQCTPITYEPLENADHCDKIILDCINGIPEGTPMILHADSVDVLFTKALSIHDCSCQDSDDVSSICTTANTMHLLLETYGVVILDDLGRQYLGCTITKERGPDGIGQLPLGVQWEVADHKYSIN